MRAHRLSPRQRADIVLLAVQGVPQATIAVRVGCGQGSVSRVLLAVEGVQRRRRASEPVGAARALSCGHVTVEDLARDPVISRALGVALMRAYELGMVDWARQ